MITFSRRRAEAATALVLLGAIVLLFVHTFSFAPSPMRGYPGAAFMPRLILIYAGIFVLLWLARLLLWRTPVVDELGIERDDTVEFEYRDYLITIAAVLGFVVALDWVGFEVACFVLLVLLFLGRIPNLALNLLVSALTTIVFYAVFVLLLNVTVPLAFLPAYISF
ncbi:MAG: Tripartite tricarboxylate transporter TctB family [Xanthobacteraceae bacterium]|jgi:hypothetical protein|nr:Tripartite tricarboxylate transporter TctB family [Xanthobacteraceae bacterium]